jgi:tetratricopeptide (TPR) repeat protein
MPFLVKAGDQAARSYSSAEAIDLYQQALELEADVDDFGPIRDAYEGLADILDFANRFPESMEAYQTLLALAEDEGDVAGQVSALNKLGAITALRMGQFQEADYYLDRAAKLASQHDEQSGLAEMTLIRCQMCTAQADFQSVIDYMGELLDVGQRLGSKEYMTLSLGHIANSLMYLTRFDEAQEAADRAMKLARETGDREHEAQLLAMTLSSLAIYKGDFEAAKAYLAEGNQIAAKIGALAAQIFGNWIRGELANLQGEYEQAISSNQLSLDMALPLEQFMPFMVVPPLGSLGTAYLHISNQFRDKVLDLHQHALRLLESPGGSAVGGAAWADVGFCALTINDLQLAAESFQKGLNQANTFTYLEKARLLAGSALLALAKGEPGEANRLADDAQAYAQERGLRHVLPLTYLTQGRVAAAQGDVEAALAAFGRAEAEARAMEIRPTVWQACLAAAETLAASGRSEEALVKREAAREMIEEIGRLFKDETLRQAYLDSTLPKAAG